MESDDTGGSRGVEVRFAVFSVFDFIGSGVWWAEGEKLAWGRAEGDAGLSDNHGVDWGVQCGVFDVVFELVSSTRGSAAKFAFPDLGLGSS